MSFRILFKKKTTGCYLKILNGYVFIVYRIRVKLFKTIEIKSLSDSKKANKPKSILLKCFVDYWIMMIKIITLFKPIIITKYHLPDKTLQKRWCDWSVCSSPIIVPASLLLAYIIHGQLFIIYIIIIIHVALRFLIKN